PGAMLATSTHDTKRSEDVRARINVLSEMPDEWRKALTRWSRLNRRKKIDVDGVAAPDRNEEYLLYQTLLGIWPFEPMDAATHATFIERVQGYMIKAIREAKINTSWLNPNNQYDEAVRAFVAAILEDSPSNRFLADFRTLAARVAHFGAWNSLAQTLLKLAAPGVPDIYQGTELWDLSLVDPDNRRPVNFDLRAWWLGEMTDLQGSRVELARALVENKADGRIKLYLTHRALQFRRAHLPLFQGGSYTPLEASAGAAEHVVAFARADGEGEALAIAPRLPARLTGGDGAPLGVAWGDGLLQLPASALGARYRNIFTDEVYTVGEHEGVQGLPLAQVLANFPVALLERVAASPALVVPRAARNGRTTN
ncbi:hypothetical protein SE17_26175, partial [Kouleothrix aurantiaca]